MPNILITTRCNKKCVYCFAKEKVDIGYKSTNVVDKEISLENLDIIISFLKKSNCRKFALIGGEPTLHSKFKEIINRLYAHDFMIHLFSNATWKASYNKFFESIELNRLTFLLNINPPEYTDANEWNIINNNLKALEGRDRVTLGLNIFEPEFKYRYLIDLARKYKFKFIRWSLTNPIIGKKGNHFVPLKDAPLYSDRIVKFSDECAKNNIETASDCSIPLCMFSERQIGRLMLNKTLNLLNNICIGGPIDIGPDLNIWKCFAFSELNNLRLTDFDNLMQIHTYYRRAFDKYIKELLPTDKCYNCRLLKNNLCAGGCMAHTVIKHGLKLEEEAII